MTDEIHDVVCCDCMDCLNWRRGFATAADKLLEERYAKAQSRVAELEHAKRIMSRNEGRLHARIAQSETTVAEIERVCAQHGYKPNAGTPVADWLRKRLARGCA